jgi:hypothetical protein
MTCAPHARLIGWLLLSTIPAAYGQVATPKFKFKYICGPGRYWTSRNGGERHYCFDGKHYSQSTGGVPAFVLDYWKRKARESQELREGLEKNREHAREVKAANDAIANEYRRKHGLPSVEEQERISMEKHRELVERNRARAGLAPQARPPGGQSTVAASGAPAPEPGTKPRAKTVEPERLKGVAPGAGRAAVMDALGQPHAAITNLGSDGDEELLTYLLEGGGQAQVQLKNGKVLSVRLP